MSLTVQITKPRHFAGAAGGCDSARSQDQRGRSSSLEHRQLHLIDLLNLSRGERCKSVLVEALDRYLVTAAWAEGDIAVVGLDSITAPEVAWTLPAAVALRCSPRAGGRVLLDYAADITQLARSFDRVVIGSGDHRFTTLARHLRRVGVRVTVVSPPGQLAADLYGVADRVRLLAVPAATSRPPLTNRFTRRERFETPIERSSLRVAS